MAAASGACEGEDIETAAVGTVGGGDGCKGGREQASFESSAPWRGEISIIDTHSARLSSFDIQFAPLATFDTHGANFFSSRDSLKYLSAAHGS